MQKDPRVFNLTNGSRLRFNQARRAVENCECAWVVIGESIRCLNLAESIAARAKQAKDREPLPYSEIHGLTYEAPAGGDRAYRESRVLAYEASLFVEDMSIRGMSV